MVKWIFVPSYWTQEHSKVSSCFRSMYVNFDIFSWASLYFPFCEQMSSFLVKLPSPLQMAWTRAGWTTHENLCVMQNNFSPRDPAKSLFIEQERPCKNPPFYQLLMLRARFSQAVERVSGLRLRHVCYGVCVCVHVHPPKSTRRDAIFRFFVTLAASKVWLSWQPGCQKWMLKAARVHTFGERRVRNNNLFCCIASNCMAGIKIKGGPSCR